MGDTNIRTEIQELLEGGLETEIYPRADTSEDVNKIVNRLQKSGASLIEKLAIAGFTLNTIEHGGIEQPCETCMYYLVHRKYCELPELDVPVEPEWSCRLWRI